MSLNDSSNMDWQGKSFLSLGPDADSDGESAKKEMFPGNSQKSLTTDQAEASAYARLEAISNDALAQLKAGVKVSQFMVTLRKVTEFRENKNDEEVTKFMTSLAEVCDRVAETEKDVLFLVESRWSRQRALPWMLVVLRASQDLLGLFVNAPNRVGGFFSYFVDQTDLIFPKNSGLRMKLYRVENTNALKSKLWTTSAENKIEDLICDTKSNLNALYSSLAPTWISDETPELEHDDEESEASKWLTTAHDLAKKSKEAGAKFIQHVDQMQNWSLEETCNYLKTWSDKARLTNVLSYDHLREATLVTVQSDGELRALSTRFDLKRGKSVVERVNLPHYAREWSVITNGRSFANDEGGFAAGVQYRRPRGARGNHYTPYQRGRGRGYRSSGYRR